MYANTFKLCLPLLLALTASRSNADEELYVNSSAAYGQTSSECSHQFQGTGTSSLACASAATGANSVVNGGVGPGGAGSLAASFDVSVTGDYSTGGGSVSTAINDFIRIPANLTAARFLTINLSLTGGFNEFCSSGLGCQFDNDVWSSADVGDDSHSFVSLSERVNLMSGQSHPYAVPPLNTWIVPIYPGFQNYFSYGLDISGGMSCIAAQSCDGFAQASYSDPPVIQILDTNMNVISGATIESELGIDYSRTSTVSTPEPARTEWVGLSIFALLLYRKKRSQARHSMAA